jgi:hypothetical protein
MQERLKLSGVRSRKTEKKVIIRGTDTFLWAIEKNLFFADLTGAKYFYIINHLWDE